MIVEYVLFKSPPGKTRDEILADAKMTVPKWRANQELVRKHYIESEDGYGGAFYIWPSREAAERGHDAAVARRRRAAHRQRSGDPLFRSADDRRQRGRQGDGISGERRGARPRQVAS